VAYYAEYRIMRPYIYRIAIVIGLVFALTGTVADRASAKDDAKSTVLAPTGPVYIIPIEGVIERALLTVLRRGFAEAKEHEATTIIFHMNTPGGLVSATEEIIRMLIDLPEGITTYTFVDKDALSAGSMIAVSTDHIYMSPGSRIGASAVITLTGDLPEGDSREKTFSAVTELVTSSAKRHGHDEDLVESMIRKEKEYKIGKEVICPVGELLTLSDIEAQRIVKRDGKKGPLLSSGTAKNLDELLSLLKFSEAEIVTITITPAEKIARYIELFSILFLAGGALGLYIEFKSPGFGVPGIAGILLLAIFFWGHHISGLSGMLEIILFFIGVILVLLEIFFIPGFGIPGISGILLILLSITMSLVEHIPGGSIIPPTTHIENAIMTMSLTCFLSAVAMIFLTRFLPNTSFFDRLTLSASISDTVQLTSVAMNDVFEGAEGTAVTELRPAGIADFNGRRIDVISNGDFISKGSNVKIAEIHGNHVEVNVV
jgi:membrane-bound serine protease (ClpP class)